MTSLFASWAGPPSPDAAWPPGQAPTNRLYRNKRDGTFEDVTDGAGLRRTAWSSSVCVADYDNDGWLDLFVTAYGTNVLYHNRQGRFEDVTAAAGLPVTGTRWGSGCTFVDYDRDGKVDLFVANYLKFDLTGAAEPGSGANCTWTPAAARAAGSAITAPVRMAVPSPNSTAASARFWIPIIVAA